MTFCFTLLSPIIKCTEHWKLDEMMWAFKDKANLDDTAANVQKIIEWRTQIVPFLNILKTIAAFKTSNFKLSVNSMVSQALPIKKEIEECFASFCVNSMHS